MPITRTYDLAMAASRDAGNRSMRAAGRTAWSPEDAQAASREFDRLYGRPDLLDAPPADPAATYATCGPFDDPDDTSREFPPLPGAGALLLARIATE